MNPSSVPPALWSDDEIEYREDGYLYVKDEEKSEEQPLLLSSTETLLKALYPSMSRESMLFQGKGHQAPGDPLLNEILGPSLVESEGNLISTQDTPMGMEQGKGEASNEEMDVDEASGEAMAVDDVDAKKDPKPAANDEKGEGKKKKNNKPKIPPEYSAYQNLTRVDNLGNKVQSALLDIQFCRHRNRREQNRERISRDQAKVRALEHQQQRLLSQRSESTGENSVASGDEDEGDGDQQNEAAGEDGFRESPTIRLARTINSIRALCPHLLPILNHPRRNDRQLVIRKTNYKSKKKAMCWLLGTQGFDTTTRKTCINAHKDVLNILESFISADDAQQIADDPLGAPDFWPNQWIQQIVKRATPKIQNPLTILSERGYAVGEIKTVALECDKLLNKDGAEGNTHDIQQRYHTAVERLHQRLVKLLTDRFPNARVSIYGSCLSNLSLGKGADVDLSLWIPEAERLKTAFHDGEIEASVYEKDMKRFVYQVFHKFKNLQREFRGMQPITRARVPVVKGTYNFAHNPYSSDGSIK